MKLFLIASWYPTPKNKLLVPFISQQAKALKDSGIDVTVISAEIISIKNWEKPGIYKYLDGGVKVYQYILPFYRFGIKSLQPEITGKLIKKMFSIAVKEHGEPDIIHIHSFRFAGKSGVDLARKYDIPCILTEHYSSIIKDNLTEIEEKYLKYTVKNCKNVLAVSSALSEKLFKYGVKSSVLPNFTDEQIFNYRPIPHQPFRFVTCGWLSSRKGIDVLLKAFSDKRFENDELIVIGDGSERNNLENMAKELKINNRVNFAGSKNPSEIAGIYRSCDVFVLPSRAETFGVVYIEANAAGLPVIATKCGGPEDILNDNNGIFIEIDDIKALADAMKYIKDNKSLYNPEIISGECLKRFGKERIIKELIKIYNGMI